MGDDQSVIRPAAVCQALLAAVEAAEGRRRKRKRDTTPDAIGLAIKRNLLEQAVKEDPAPEIFEAWLIHQTTSQDVSEPTGALMAMARNVYEEWRMAHTVDVFKAWLEHGAPSDDATGASEKPPPRAWV